MTVIRPGCNQRWIIARGSLVLFSSHDNKDMAIMALEGLVRVFIGMMMMMMMVTVVVMVMMTMMTLVVMIVVVMINIVIAL